MKSHQVVSLEGREERSMGERRGRVVSGCCRGRRAERGGFIGRGRGREGGEDDFHVERERLGFA